MLAKRKDINSYLASPSKKAKADATDIDPSPNTIAGFSNTLFSEDILYIY